MIKTVKVLNSGGYHEPVKVCNNAIPSSTVSRSLWKIKERVYPVANPSGLPVCKGDTVEILLPPGQTVLTALFVFLLPLLLFPLGYSLTGILLDSPGGEVIPFLAGFFLLLAGIPLGCLICRMFVRFGDGPKIIRILSSEETGNCDSKRASDCGGCCGGCG